jgi:ATP-dependent helicase/nuclease subunit A
MIPEGYILCSKKSGLFHTTTLSHPVRWEEKAEEERLYAGAEEQRLMYVASTRARDCLVVSTYEGKLGGREAWSSLDDHIQDVPELEIPDVSVVEEREKLRLEKGEWEGAKERISERRDVVSMPGYAVESVTSLAKKDMEVPEWRRGSYGMAWGRAVHKMLEILARWNQDLDDDGNVAGASSGDGDSSEGTGADRYKQNLALLAGNILVTEEISMEKKDELVSLVESIMKSEFWERVNKAEKKLFEVPFSIITDKEAMGIAEREEARARTSELKTCEKSGSSKKDTIDKKTDGQKLPIILTGVIDLAFLESGGWVIADFKTDDLRDYHTDDVRDSKTGDVRDKLESFVHYYAPQVKIYSRFWAEITKQPIKEAGLYFTSINKWVEVK